VLTRKNRHCEANRATRHKWLFSLEKISPSFPPNS
jgi:hypothetical protein